MAVADVLITDYSAIMFDYALTRKPCFLYTSDLETYKSEDRDLYFDIESLPFSFAENNQELVRHIEQFNLKEYLKKIDIFLKQEVGTFDDGNACGRVFVELNRRLEDGNNEK